jgi:ATP-binding cassette subfamily B protein
MYDADGGRILLDGQDLREISHASLRRAIGVVPQDAMLFNNTIAYNIGYGRAGATLAEIIGAAKAARIHDLIQSLPAQYETMVGERGVKLSGGERQRIAIARAILKNPPLLIFDEATSALDSHTEKAIQEELERLAQGRTTLIIAHRLSTIVDADQILVMEHGRIIERGSHDDLLQQKGRYAQMWNLQRQEKALNELELRLTKQPVNLVALLGGVIDAIRPLADSNDITFYTVIEQDTIRVTGDPSVLQHVLIDLCEHAISVTPRGGRMELRLELRGDEACIRVTDDRLPPKEAAVVAASEAGAVTLDGPPEMPAAMEKVIDPLRIGTLMERMGGRLMAEHVEDGPAMSYALYLPLRAVSPVTVAPSSTTSPADTDLTGLTIAVADDREEARMLVGEVLEDRGATVLRVESGEALLEALKDPAQRWPDMLVCDLGLGDPDGYQVIEEIRRVESRHGRRLAHNMPAIALSGYGERRDRLRALLAGFQIHITKPVDARELLASVAAVAPRKPTTGSPRVSPPDTAAH